jgi:hypothetical protein
MIAWGIEPGTSRTAATGPQRRSLTEFVCLNMYNFLSWPAIRVIIIHEEMYQARIWAMIFRCKYIQTNSVALSPLANYTDWATATCRRNLVSTFVDRRVSRCQRGGFPTVVNLSFLDRKCKYIYIVTWWIVTIFGVWNRSQIYSTPW